MVGGMVNVGVFKRKQGNISGAGNGVNVGRGSYVGGT